MYFDQENFCKYVGSVGIRKSCDMTSLEDTRSIGEYDFSKLNENDVLYMKLDKIPEFSQHVDKLKYKIVLVSGCSDYTTPNDLFASEEQFLKFINSPKISHWFVQNCIVTHPKITLMPIGLDYHTMAGRSMEWGPKTTPVEQEHLLNAIIAKAIPFEQREIKCYSNFHFQINTKYGYDRVDAINQVPKNLVHYEPSHIKRINTWKIQSKYAFVLSPHGNGLDCHRTWEALVLGCIPIVKTSPLDSLYSDLPVLIVNSWSDITQELLDQTIVNFQKRTFNYDKLLLSYWIRKIRSYTNRIRLFNLDLHISVIEDVKNILYKLYDSNVKITQWSLSGHTWVFGIKPAQVDIVNQQTWKYIDKQMIEQFTNHYFHFLNTFDGFIVTHSPVFTLLYEKLNKPIILINSTRYELPFSWPWKHNLEMWDYLTCKLKQMHANSQLFVISNNQADHDYLQMATGIDSCIISSLCKYTNSTYNPQDDNFIIYSDYSEIIQQKNNIIKKSNYVGDNYKYENLYKCKGIIHLPYQISTMSLFEQYTANIPLLFPTKRLLKELVSNKIAQFDVRYTTLFDGNKRKYPAYLSDALDDDKYIDFFIDRADYYNEDVFKYISYYDSLDSINDLVNNLDTKQISKQMTEWNKIREKKIYLQWKQFFSNIFDIKKDVNFISGYEFAKLAKWSFCPRYPIKFEPNSIQLNDFIFLNLDCIGQFVQILNQTKPSNKFILLTHNSDQKFTNYHLDILRPYITQVYAINCAIQDPLVIPIPLGFVDSKHKPHNKFEEIVSSQNSEKNILCYMNFAINTNPIKRQECYNTFVDKDWVCKESNIPPEDFYRQVSISKYVLSPEGTGIDCHRIYESIYLGSIPVLKTSELDYFYKSLPVLIVSSWDQITQYYLELNYLDLKLKLDQWVKTNPKWTDAKFWIKEKNTCATCGYLCGNLKCGKCGIVSYCNRTCQITNWPIHKIQCNNNINSKNKSIASFTQTYSNNRQLLYDYHNKDIVDINFRNKLDKNYYVFHNSNDSYIQHIINCDYMKKIKNLIEIKYNNMSYTQTFYQTLNKCKADGIKYIFFLQDDVFSQVSDKIIDELMIFIKNNTFDMLNIEVDNININAPIIYSNDNIKIYNTTSDDFKNKGLWAFDDGPYVANIEFLLNSIYDANYFSKNDIWNAENYLNNKITNSKIQRLTCNISLFRRYGIVGPNAWNSTNELILLNKLFK